MHSDTAAQDQVSAVLSERHLLIMELHDACQFGVTVADFASRLAIASVRLTGARSSAVWLWSSQNVFQIAGREALDADLLRRSEQDWQQHGELLLKCCQSSRVVQVNAGEEFDGVANPTEMDLALVATDLIDGRGVVIEVFFDRGQLSEAEAGFSSETAEFGHDYEMFLPSAARLATDYLRAQKLLEMARSQQAMQVWVRFLRSLHGSLDLQEVSSSLVNDTRALMECDRVVLCIARRDTFYVAAVTAQSQINARSDQVRAMRKLASETAAVSARECFVANPGSAVGLFWDHAIKEYRELCSSRSLAVCPLHRKTDTAQSPQDASASIIGVLFLERFQDDFDADAIADDLERLQQHASLAVANSLDHNRILLRSLQGKLGGALRSSLRGGRWLKLLLPILIVLLLIVVPVPFRLTSEGVLRAREQQGVFAPEAGIVREVLVQHGDEVLAGQPLAILENVSLSVQLQDLEGQLVQNQERLAARRSAQSGTAQSAKARVELDGEIAELEQSIVHLEHRVELLKKRIQSLTIVAPVDGTIVTWDTQRKLINRPLSTGDLLMDVANTDGEWAVEIRVPERSVGYILEAWQNSGDAAIGADYLMATEPEKRYRGHLIDLSERTEGWRGQQVVYGTIAVDPDAVPKLREGADIRARILCGQRSAGFVCLRELIEFFQMRVLF